MDLLDQVVVNIINKLSDETKYLLYKDIKNEVDGVEPLNKVEDLIFEYIYQYLYNQFYNYTEKLGGENLIEIAINFK